MYHEQTAQEDLANSDITNMWWGYPSENHKLERLQNPAELWSEETYINNMSTFSNSKYVSPGIIDIKLHSDNIAACCSSGLALFKPIGPSKTCNTIYDLAVSRT